MKKISKPIKNKIYTEKDLKDAFESAREFNSLDGIVDVHVVLNFGGDVSDLQPLYPTFKCYINQKVNN